MKLQAILFGNVDPCLWWMTDASAFIKRTRQDNLGTREFEKDLLRLVQLIDVVNSMARLILPSGDDIAAHNVAFNQARLLSDTNTPRSARDIKDRMISTMWQWCVLQKRFASLDQFFYLNTTKISRMIVWVAGVSTNTASLLTAEQKLNGIDIICSATTLQIEALQIFSDSTNTSGSDFESSALYSYWTILSISQHLHHDAWRLLDCDLPIMPLGHRHQHALSTFECLERLAESAGLCIAMLLPVILSMGFEMTSSTERSRILRVLDNQASRGFELSTHFKDAITTMWDMLGSSQAVRHPVHFWPCYMGSIQSSC